MSVKKEKSSEEMEENVSPPHVPILDSVESSTITGRGNFGIVPSSDDEDKDDDEKGKDSNEGPPGLVQSHKTSLDADEESPTTISQTSKEIRRAARRSRARSISRQGSGLNLNRSRSRTNSSRRSRASSSRRRMTITDRNKWTDVQSFVNSISVHHFNLPMIMKLKQWAKRAVKRVRKARIKKSESSQNVLVGEDGKRRRYIADYFLICGIDETKWDVTKTKPEEMKMDLMEPSILQQYPENDDDLSIPPLFESWALPDHLHIITDPEDLDESKFHHAPLTDEKGSRYYMGSTRMYVVCSSSRISLSSFAYSDTELEHNHSYHLNKLRTFIAHSNENTLETQVRPVTMLERAV